MRSNFEPPFQLRQNVRPESLHEEVFLSYQGEPLSERGVRKMLAKSALQNLGRAFPKRPATPPEEHPQCSAANPQARFVSLWSTRPTRIPA